MMPYRNEDIDQLASSYGKEVNPDVEAALAAVKRRINADDGPAILRQMPPRRRWLGVAATALLLIAAGYFGLVWDSGTVLANDGTTPMQVELPDGTEVTLQEGATLRYAANYNETERRIDLAGQAFFAVNKDKTRPFLVSNAETELRVTGTAFNLRIEGGELEVEVSEGSVELRKGADVVPVKANECGTAVSGKPNVVRPAPHLNRHAWRTGKLYFQDAELAVVLATIEANFGVSATVEGSCTYAVSGTYSADSPVAILRNVARLGGGDVQQVTGEEDTYKIVRVCN